MNSKVKFTPEQMDKQIDSLHDAVHWLLLHKELGYDKLDQYIDALISRVSGLNKLLDYPPGVITLLSLLYAIQEENQKEDCNFKLYRKLVFDAHSAVDKIRG